MKGRIDTVSRKIAASPHTLYQAFMNPDALVQWMPPEGMTGKIDDFQSKTGGGYKMTLTYEDADTHSGKTTANTDTLALTFVELVPDKKIAGTAVFDTEDPEVTGELLMSWYFEEWDGATKVTIVVENVPAGISKDAHIEGLNSTLDHLEQFVQSPSGN